MSSLLSLPLLLACDANLAFAQAESKHELKLFVPAYFYPAGEGRKDWQRLIAAAKRVPIVAIANPASGPGKRIDPNYTEVIEQAIRAGATVIGYVSTSYAKRPIDEVKADVDRWRQFYPAIRGVFFDEQTSDESRLAYYRELFAYARDQIADGFVASNPGVACDAGYFVEGGPDAICVFEHHDGYERFAPPAAWNAGLRRRCAVLPYQTRGAEQMHERLRRAAEWRLGYFYATDDAGANPWDRLPGYWDEEVAAVEALLRAAK